MWNMTSQKNGISALGLQRILGLGSYRTAWLMLHKLRQAMVRPGRERLRGVVEVDETYWGTMALGLKCVSLSRIAETLVEVYLGKDAGRLVLQGRISRGMAELINAVLWFSDLRSYTSLADSIEPPEVIPLLNDYPRG